MGTHESAVTSSFTGAMEALGATWPILGIEACQAEALQLTETL